MVLVILYLFEYNLLKYYSRMNKLYQCYNNKTFILYIINIRPIQIYYSLTPIKRQ